MIILAAVAIAAIAGFTAVVLKMLADGREMRRLLAPQIRLVAPPKQPAPTGGTDEDEVYLAGPRFASGDGGAQ